MSNDLSITLVCMAMALFVTPPTIQAQPGKVVAWMSDGQFIEGRNIDGWSLQKPTPRINNKRLFAPRRRALVIRRLGVQPHLEPPYVRLKNGDVIPGRLAGLTKASSHRSDTDFDHPNNSKRLRIIPEGGITVPGAKLSASSKRIKAVVRTPEALSTLKPGMVMLADGRRFRPEAMTWTEDGLRMLLDDGMIHVGPGQIAGLKVNMTQPLQTYPKPGLKAHSRVGRILTRDGAVLTFWSNELQLVPNNAQPEKRAHLIQPPWSSAPIKIAVNRIIIWSYHAADRVPLSLLPVQVHSPPGPSGYKWPWKVNANVRGHIASVGRRSALLAIGVHGPSQLRFDLPANSQTFTAWVGLDEAVRDGGSVALSIFAGPTSSEPAWTSGRITGKAQAKKIGPINLRHADSLTLQIDDRSAEVPREDDPLDIRDEVTLLRPLVLVGPVDSGQTTP